MKRKDALILWDYSAARGVHNVLLVGKDGTRHPQRYSDGAAYAEWPEHGSLTVVFGQMLAQGFTSPAAMVEALERFAALDDCGSWAVGLIDGIRAWGGL